MGMTWMGHEIRRLAQRHQDMLAEERELCGKYFALLVRDPLADEATIHRWLVNEAREMRERLAAMRTVIGDDFPELEEDA